jgi:hypothetical protein
MVCAKTVQILHFPNLKTVLAVEEVLKKADLPLTREEIKKRLETKIMHQTLNVILEYMEERGMVLDGRKGVLWVYDNNHPRLLKAERNGLEV